MHKFIHSLPGPWHSLATVSLISMLVACGGGSDGGGGSSLPPVSSKWIVEDAAIVNAKVTDAVGRTATQVGRGEYKFLDDSGSPVVPTLPVTVSSQNVFSGGVIPNGNPTTFQDLDRNGVFSAGDIAFNGTYTVRYAERGTSVIYANPVAALIPSTWNGSSAVAGLSADLLKAALSSSVETTTNTQLKQVTSLLTALSDSIGTTLSSNGMTNSQVSVTLSGLLVAVGSTAGVNLLDANAATKLGEAASSTVAAAPLPPANVNGAVASATNIATNLQKLSSAVAGSVTNYEAIVQVAQSSPSLATSSYDLAAGQSDTLNKDVTIQNARAVAVNSLRLVPYCDLVVGQVSACNPTVVGDWLSFGRLSDFRALGQQDGSIVITGSGPLFSSFSFESGLAATFRSNSNSWKYVHPSSTSLEISLAVSFKDPNGLAQTGNLMQICNASGNCVPYYLSAAAGVCNLVTTNSVVDQVLLDKINALNSQKTACPAFSS